ncbi:MAG: retropepsin-like aspartic protease [Bacteroidales bacterium]|jgi:predicted aspartyl protease|nr:clan AA aspartic protease [Bacteroidales bacterium]MDI9575720.1 retropepsin-like aspartic protease [Bacteroidota bacterium]MDD2593058.1 retropepsin-like aspartic protease [Bacteroidales bacterium]MDD3756060.1 retropepsin-like aspartic protease [Bacteroidales bacterium]MDY0400230.1 retropepsin-like aspartic protease [Bacteroidales bacterium]
MVTLPIFRHNYDIGGAHYFVNLIIDSLPIDFLIDTGATNTVISIDLAKQLESYNKKINLSDNPIITFSDTISEVAIIPIINFQIGEEILNDIIVVATDFSFIKNQSSIKEFKSFDAVLGMDLLTLFKTKIDFKNNKIDFFLPSKKFLKDYYNNLLKNIP